MLEDGSWKGPPRPRRSNEFVPIEEVSIEDLHPGYDIGPRTPEEALIAQEHEEELERNDGIADQRTIGKKIESEMWKEYAERLQKEDSETEGEYAWEGREQDEAYQQYVDQLTSDMASMEERGEGWEHLMDRYKLPRKWKLQNVERQIKESRRALRQRNRKSIFHSEPKGKHMKGAESIKEISRELIFEDRGKKRREHSA